MKLLTALIILILGSVDFVNSQVTQQWFHRFNGLGNNADRGKSIVVDASGNVYVTGESYNTGGFNSDILTIKYNSFGFVQWAQRYNGPGNSNDFGISVGVDASGNVYAAGSSTGTGTGSDITVIKYNSIGVHQWTQRFNAGGNGNDVANSMVVDADGNVYVTGSSIRTGTGVDYTTIKYNTSGSQNWVQHYHYQTSDIANSIWIDASGNAYVTGNSFGNTSNNDITTIKYNSSGVQQWVQRYNGTGNAADVGYSIGVDASGNSYVTGYSTGSGSGRDIITVKYNSSGVQQWAKNYNGTASQSDEGNSLVVDPSGNVYVTGSSSNTSSNSDYTTLKYNSAGDQQWVQTYTGQSSSGDVAKDIVIDALGNAYVTGFAVGNGYDYVTIKYTSSGVREWVKAYNGIGNSDRGNAITVDGSGNVYVTGESIGTGTSYDFVTIKYTQSNVFSGKFKKNGLNKTIHDLQSSYDTINVQYESGTTYYVQDVNLNIDTLLHTNDSDLEFYLIHNSVTDTVIYQTGGSGHNFINTVLNDSASMPISGGTAPFSGEFKPATPLSQFNNQDINGTWILKVYDRNTGNTGTLQAWSLDFLIGTILTGINTFSNEVPDGFSLSQNYPNPFNPSTNIQFAIPQSSFVKLEVFSALGESVGVLVSEELNTGSYNYSWDASGYASGIYIFRITAGDFKVSKKMILMR